MLLGRLSLPRVYTLNPYMIGGTGLRIAKEGCARDACALCQDLGVILRGS